MNEDIVEETIEVTEIKDSEKQNSEQRHSRNFSGQFNQFAQKSADVVKTGFHRAAEFTGSAAQLTKIKMQIYNLQHALEKRYEELGRKLYDLRDADKIDNVKSFFSEHFDKIGELTQQIEEKKEAAAKIQLVKGGNSMESRDAYIDKLATQLKEWNKDISELKGKADHVKEDMKAKYHEEIDALKKLADDAQMKLKELRNSGAGAWQDVKIGAEKSWNELKVALAEAKKKF